MVLATAGGSEAEAQWTSEVEALAHWTVSYVSAAVADIYGSPPLVAEVHLLDAVLGEVRILFDAQMVPDVAYEVTTTAFGEALALEVVGPRHPRRDSQLSAVEPLLDIDVPLVRPTGRGGDYTRNARSDLALSGGLASIERLIWHRVFTVRGELDWAPEHGTVLRLKELRPRALREEEARLRRLVEEVLGVISAQVTITFEPRSDHAYIAIRAETKFGLLQTQRAVGPADEGAG